MVKSMISAFSAKCAPNNSTSTLEIVSRSLKMALVIQENVVWGKTPVSCKPVCVSWRRSCTLPQIFIKCVWVGEGVGRKRNVLRLLLPAQSRAFPAFMLFSSLHCCFFCKMNHSRIFIETFNLFFPRCCFCFVCSLLFLHC